jgi:hypothetical protein
VPSDVGDAAAIANAAVKTPAVHQTKMPRNEDEISGRLAAASDRDGGGGEGGAVKRRERSINKRKLVRKRTAAAESEATKTIIQRQIYRLKENNNLLQHCG